MNILMLLTPKQDTGWIINNFTIKKSLSKLHEYNFSGMPVITENGNFYGILTEGDILKLLKEKAIIMDEDLDKINLSEIKAVSERKAIKCDASLEELINIICNQNFVPVIDDRNMYIGIITRKSVINYLYKK